jgi:hypothetical protein
MVSDHSEALDAFTKEAKAAELRSEVGTRKIAKLFVDECEHEALCRVLGSYSTC